MPEPDGAAPSPAQASEEAQQVMLDGLQTLKSAMESGEDVSLFLLAMRWPLRGLHTDWLAPYSCLFTNAPAICQNGSILIGSVQFASFDCCQYRKEAFTPSVVHDAMAMSQRDTVLA